MIMKKILLFIMLIAGFMLASCDKENPNSDNGQSDSTEKPDDGGQNPDEPIDIDLTETSYWKGTVGNEEIFICLELLTEEGKEELSPIDDKYTNMISTIIKDTESNALNIFYGLITELQDELYAEYIEYYISLPRIFTATADGLSSSYGEDNFILSELSKDEFDDGIKTEAAEISYWESEKDDDGVCYFLSIKELSNTINQYYPPVPFNITIFKNSIAIGQKSATGQQYYTSAGYIIGNTIFISNGPELTLFTIDGNEITGTYNGQTITMTKTEQQTEIM